MKCIMQVSSGKFEGRYIAFHPSRHPADLGYAFTNDPNLSTVFASPQHAMEHLRNHSVYGFPYSVDIIRIGVSIAA